MIVEKFAAEGCNVAINYLSNAGRAEETAQKAEKAYNAKTLLIQGVGSRGSGVWLRGLTEAACEGCGCTCGL